MKLYRAQQFLICILSSLVLSITSINSFAADDPNANGSNLIDVVYFKGSGYGTFMNVGSGKWIEVNSDGTFTFTEYARDEWSVYLKKSNGAYVMLDAWRNMVGYKDTANANFRDLYVIYERNAFDDYPVKLYEHYNYGGIEIGLPQGEFVMADLERRGLRNDTASSIKVRSGIYATLFQHDNFSFSTSPLIIAWFNGGYKEDFYGDSISLGKELNDKVSSVKVRVNTPGFSCDGWYGYFELLAQDFPISSSCD